MTTIVSAGALLAACSKSSDSPANNNNPGGNTTLISADLETEIDSVGDRKISGTNIVIRQATGNTEASFKAFSLICTHQGCTVKYEDSGDEFNCPCHGSKYDGNGGVVNGPATKPLNKLKVTVTGNELIVT